MHPELLGKGIRGLYDPNDEAGREVGVGRHRAGRLTDVLRQIPLTQRRVAQFVLQRLDQLVNGGRGRRQLRITLTQLVERPQHDQPTDPVEQSGHERVFRRIPLSSSQFAGDRSTGDRVTPQHLEHLSLRLAIRLELTLHKQRRHHRLDLLEPEPSDGLRQIGDRLHAAERSRVGGP
jgi:hypothetical protein